MKKNSVRVRLRQGAPAIGTWLILPDPSAARLVARTGFDWLTVELEHSATSLETAALSFALIAAEGVVPLARVPCNSGENIKRVLDTGAWGIVVPMVNSRAEAEAAIAAARYQPLGRRSIGGQLHAANFDTDPATYYARANEEILVVLMIEHVDALATIDEIAALPGLDALFIGPNDLLNSMGRPPAFESDDPAFIQAVSRVLEAARRRGVAAGIHVADEEAAARRVAEGFQFIAVSSEAGLMLARAQQVTRALGCAGRGLAKY